LFGRSFCKRDIDQPTTFVVQDVGTDFTDLFGSSIAVEVIVLYLEVLSHGDENVEGFLECGRRSDARHVKCECDGEVEGVVGGFVYNDEVMSTSRYEGS